MNRSSSTRLTLLPSQPFSSVALIASAFPVLAPERSEGTSQPRGKCGAFCADSSCGLPLLSRRPLDGLDDVHVAGAAADLAGDRPADLLFRRVRVLREERARRQHHPGRAEPALEAVLLLEPLLERVQAAGGSEALDGRDLAAVRLDGEVGAGLDRRAVDEHGAGAASRRVAADVDAGQTGAPQPVDEQE